LLAGKQTTNLASISKSSLGEMPVFLPRLEEQRAIAAALADVDALIAGLEKLIAKKRDLKQAAMQQLLTGQTRLPGFSGEWELRQLRQSGTFLKGSGVKRDEAMSGELPCVRYGEIYTVHSDVVRTFHSRISPQVAATATPIQKGDLLFAGSGETKAEIGKCVAMALPMEAYAGGDIVILRLRSGNPSFFGYLLNTPAVVRQKSNLGQGDAVVHISALALSSIEVQVPSMEEQTAIAAVLSDMDADLSELQASLAKTRELKQGMMQELLTGRTRLV
jgi:type I restriction enzyme S subunit